LGAFAAGDGVDDLSPERRAELAGNMDVLIAELVAARMALQTGKQEAEP